MASIYFLTIVSFLVITIKGLSIKNNQAYNIPQVVSKGEYTLDRTKCIDQLGCFNIDGNFFHPIYRPINLKPFDREFINVRYRIYSKDSGDKYQLLPATKVTSKNVTEINIDPKLETKLIVHGWIDNQIFGDWMRNLKDDYYKQGNFNIIVVDWSGGNAPPYTQAVANTRVVGAEIALLINTLKLKKGLNPKMVHLMGHSLGGQIVGYAGERIKGLGRITSLDPAEPFYQYMPPEVRIDPTDAEFVEVIHSDSKSILLAGLGMSQLAGHVDFFPNNGRDQPGCTRDKLFSIFTDGLIEGVRNIVACDHIRAVNYFRDTINSKCQMVGYACHDWEMFLAGKCADCGKKGEKCAILGERSIEYASNKNDSKPVKMFLKTNNKGPYCLYQYHVQIKLQAGSMKDQNGDTYLEIIGSNQNEEFKLTSSKQGLYHGATYNDFVTTPKDLGSIKGLTFRWKSTSFSIFSTPKLFLEQIKVTPMNEVNLKQRDIEIRHVCAKKSAGINSGKSVSFKSFSKC